MSVTRCDRSPSKGEWWRCWVNLQFKCSMRERCSAFACSVLVTSAILRHAASRMRKKKLIWKCMKLNLRAMCNGRAYRHCVRLWRKRDTARAMYCVRSVYICTKWGLIHSDSLSIVPILCSSAIWESFRFYLVLVRAAAATAKNEFKWKIGTQPLCALSLALLVISPQLCRLSVRAPITFISIN